MKVLIFFCFLFLGPNLVRGAPAQSLDADYTARFAGIVVGDAHVTGAVMQTSYWVRIVGGYDLLGFSGGYDGSVAGVVVDGTRLYPTSYQATSVYQAPFSPRRTRKAIFVRERTTYALRD